MISEERMVEENKVLFDKLQKTLDELYPFFDSIQIFCVKHVNNQIGTTRFIDGRGDYYSCYGLVKQWTDDQSLEFKAVTE